jgi:glucose/arabinose dehydrogenase
MRANPEMGRKTMRKLGLILTGTLAACALGANSMGARAQSTAPAAAAPAAAPATTTPPPADKLVLAEGSDVALKFAQDLSSKTATEGDPVELVLDQDLMVNNVVVARAGSKAVGEVTHAKKAGMMGKGGELNIRLDYLRAGDARIMLRGSKGREGDDKTGTAVALTVLFGPIGLIKHGKDIDIRQGTPLKAYVAQDIALSAAPPAPPPAS